MPALYKTLLVAALLAAIAPVRAELAANIGVTSDYIWRGVSQSGESASVSGGIDYSSEGGFYAGTWVGSLDNGEEDFNGSEVDLYLGFAGEVAELSYDLGYIYYAYPSNDDIDFGEIYASLGWGDFTAGVAYTVNNAEGNDFAEVGGGAGFESGDLYAHLGYAAELEDDWSLGLTLGAYAFDADGKAYKANATDTESLTVDIDYLHYAIDFTKTTEMGDFPFTLSDTDQDDDDPRAVVSWGLSF